MHAFLYTATCAEHEYAVCCTQCKQWLQVYKSHSCVWCNRLAMQTHAHMNTNRHTVHVHKHLYVYTNIEWFERQTSKQICTCINMHRWVHTCMQTLTQAVHNILYLHTLYTNTKTRDTGMNTHTTLTQMHDTVPITSETTTGYVGLQNCTASTDIPPQDTRAERQYDMITHCMLNLWPNYMTYIYMYTYFISYVKIIALKCCFLSLSQITVRIQLWLQTTWVQNHWNSPTTLSSTKVCKQVTPSVISSFICAGRWTTSCLGQLNVLIATNCFSFSPFDSYMYSTSIWINMDFSCTQHTYHWQHQTNFSW